MPGHTTTLRQRAKDLSKLKSDKMRRFALEYMIDHNGAAAAVRAGYSEKSAKVTAAKLLKNPIIAAFIGKTERQDVEELELKRHEVLLQLWYALTRDDADFRNPDGSLIPAGELNDRARAVIDGYDVDEKIDPETGEVTSRKTKVRLVPKAAALEMSLKHKGLFAPDKHELSTALDSFFASLSRPLPPDPIAIAMQEEQSRLELEGATEDEGENGGTDAKQ